MHIKTDTDSGKCESQVCHHSCRQLVAASSSKRDEIHRRMDGWMDRRIDELFVWVRTCSSVLYYSLLYLYETLLVYSLENTQTSPRFYNRCWLTACLSEIDNGTHGTQYDRIANCGMIESTVSTIDIQIKTTNDRGC